MIQRGLRDVQPLGRAREAARVRNGEKITQVTQFHGRHRKQGAEM